MTDKTERKPGFLDAIKRQIGVHETLFLSGLAALFVGIAGLWSVFWALMVCGAVLIGVSIFSIVFENQSGAK